MYLEIYIFEENYSMLVKIEPSWQEILNDEFNKDYFKLLTEFVKEEYASTTCYPKGNQIFAAFNHCPFDKIKVVIIGQDPYHGAGQANGLCFSVNDNVPAPPSLINIFKELEKDVQKVIPQSGNLEHWSEQGVFLLNATLTVRAGLAGSHQNKGWETFTDAVIQKISEKRENIVFLLWGGYARKKGTQINRNKHLVLETGHPSPLSANRGLWFGNRHFSQANVFLESKKIAPIKW